VSGEINLGVKVDQPTEEIKLKMLEFFYSTSVPRILKAEIKSNENKTLNEEDEK
jgi:hypothetical protein